MDTGAECPVVARVRSVAARHPGRPAVVTDTGRVTYRELWRQVLGWRDRCAALGLAPGALVAVLAGPGARWPAAFLGARAAGLVPLLVDVQQPVERTGALLAAARPAAVLRSETGEAERTGEPAPRVLPPGAGYVVFTSGSTGAPKGIVGRAAGLLAFIDWEIGAVGAGPGTRVAVLTSPSFDVVFRDLLLPLCAGGEAHFAGRAVRAAPAAVLGWLAERRVEVVHAVPSLAARWLAADGSDGSVDSLRWTLFAGEPLHGRLVRRWRAAAPSTEVVNLYGPSETTLAKFHHRVPRDCGPGLLPVGRPLDGTALSLVHPEATGPVGAEVRQIVITSPDGSLGYLPGTCGDDDAERLRYAPGSGVTRFRTRDRGVLDDDGNLVVVGRLDSLVKRRGVFVDLARVEAAAAGLAGVTAACCVQLADGDVVLAVQGFGPAAAAALRRPLRTALGEGMPDRVTALPVLPLLPGGKADRRAVADLLDRKETDERRAS
ncbi:AMP-binding protein [Streptomyces sp. NBC_00209]|uniref:AMP-binding protein n=1 Tax=Streptomyces sp. NBC_00209 TaxID=2975682 RepID=UPI002F90E81C